jgi:hypothetical protein
MRPPHGAIRRKEEKNMGSKKATNKVSKLHKGKKLEPTKPLLSFTKIGSQYKPQNPEG